MNKAEFVSAIAERSDLSKAKAGEVVNHIIDIVTEKLSNGESIVLPGFGTYTTAKRKERTGRNPQTGATMVIPAATVPKFKPGKSLKDAVKK